MARPQKVLTHPLQDLVVKCCHNGDQHYLAILLRVLLAPQFLVAKHSTIQDGKEKRAKSPRSRAPHKTPSTSTGASTTSRKPGGGRAGDPATNCRPTPCHATAPTIRTTLSWIEGEGSPHEFRRTEWLRWNDEAAAGSWETGRRSQAGVAPRGGLVEGSSSGSWWEGCTSPAPFAVRWGLRDLLGPLGLLLPLGLG